MSTPSSASYSKTALVSTTSTLKPQRLQGGNMLSQIASIKLCNDVYAYRQNVRETLFYPPPLAPARVAEMALLANCAVFQHLQ